MAGLFALGGVTLGVLLEPVKALFAGRAKIRQDRTELCAAIIDTTELMRSHLLLLNVHHRMREVAGQSVADETIHEIETQYFDARTELRRLRLRLQLVGPAPLVEQASRVRAADRALRDVRFELDDVPMFNRHVMPSKVKAAAQSFEAEVETFAGLARRHL
ncbi:hypothetical protein [Nocardia neocaledoniensis]|uniref:hypothetical protein n=1 Tax=Nocardia neocaledoniensis TaxID=236511 RepID=UPI002458A66D|nr:hypothetical protein [Nocardia neocaledoniensis]